MKKRITLSVTIEDIPDTQYGLPTRTSYTQYWPIPALPNGHEGGIMMHNTVWPEGNLPDSHFVVMMKIRQMLEDLKNWE